MFTAEHQLTITGPREDVPCAGWSLSGSVSLLLNEILHDLKTVVWEMLREWLFQGAVSRIKRMEYMVEHHHFEWFCYFQEQKTFLKDDFSSFANVCFVAI